MPFLFEAVYGSSFCIEFRTRIEAIELGHGTLTESVTVTQTHSFGLPRHGLLADHKENIPTARHQSQLLYRVRSAAVRLQNEQFVRSPRRMHKRHLTRFKNTEQRGVEAVEGTDHFRRLRMEDSTETWSPSAKVMQAYTLAEVAESVIMK